MSTQPAAARPAMDKRFRYVIGLVGAALLFLGVFMPAVRPMRPPERSYIGFFLPEGILMLLLVAASVFFITRRNLRRLVIVGALAIGTLAFSYLRNEHRKSASISDAYSRIYTEDAKDKETDPGSSKMKREFREAVADLVRIEEEAERYRTGWWVMTLGGLMILGAGLFTYSSVQQWVLQTFALFERPKKKCPSCAGFNVAEAVRCKHCGGQIA